MLFSSGEQGAIDHTVQHSKNECALIEFNNTGIT